MKKEIKKNGDTTNSDMKTKIASLAKHNKTSDNKFSRETLIR